MHNRAKNAIFHRFWPSFDCLLLSVWDNICYVHVLEWLQCGVQFFEGCHGCDILVCSFHYRDFIIRQAVEVIDEAVDFTLFGGLQHWCFVCVQLVSYIARFKCCCILNSAFVSPHWRAFGFADIQKSIYMGYFVEKNVLLQTFYPGHILVVWHIGHLISFLMSVDLRHNQRSIAHPNSVKGRAICR